LSDATQTRLQQEIATIGVSIQRLYAYRYQVIPFVYTHLVSLSCFLYLGCTGFLSGFQFDEDASWSFGLVLPMTFYTIKIFTTFGLFEVGEVILDPFGDDPEDFALLHFVEVTISSSWEAISIVPLLPRAADQGDYYRAKELLAAKTIIMKIVDRFRWRRVLAAARAQKELQSQTQQQQVRVVRERRQSFALANHLSSCLSASPRANGSMKIRDLEPHRSSDSFPRHSKNTAAEPAPETAAEPAPAAAVRQPTATASPRANGSMKIRNLDKREISSQHSRSKNNSIASNAAQDPAVAMRRRKKSRRENEGGGGAAAPHSAGSSFCGKHQELAA